MSYSSRVYRQRNAHSNEEAQPDASFGKQSDNPETQDAFFQTNLGVNKPADKGTLQRLTSAEDEKAGTNDARMRKDKEVQEKPMEKKDDEKDKTKPKQEDEKKATDDVKKEDEDKTKSGAVQKKEATGGGTTSAHLSSRIESPSAKGSTLHPDTLNEMNASFGNDFSDVRVHDDSEAQEMNKELRAQAFTHGKDIYFNKGKYDPDSKEGKSLLAHELTHVVQQNSTKNKD